MVDYSRINSTLGKMGYYLNNHNSICVGVSGGSDSTIIVHMIATYFREFLPKVHFMFSNTGLEYNATLRHIQFLQERYDIKIDKIRGESVPYVVKHNGFPIVNKYFSHTVPQAQRGSECATKKIYEETIYNGKRSKFGFSPKQRELAKYILQNDIKVSDKCCDYSKKKPFHKYLKENKCDLTISGERRAEGGQRATAHKDCFEQGKGIDKYMPLFFWDDETKEYYKEHEEIRYSDCYEVWGMKRTGCVGCPFGSRAGEELKLVKRYEPNLYKACMNVFGESYRLMDKFDIHRHKILESEELEGQIRFWEEE